MSYRVAFLPDARTDIEQSFAWYEERQAGLGNDFLAAIEEIVQLLEDNPMTFQVVHREIRRALTSRFPYGVYFHVIEEVVIVIAVFHASRHPRLWKRR